MRHLVRAVAQEYGKQGRLTLEADFERFHEFVRTPGERRLRAAVARRYSFLGGLKRAYSSARRVRHHHALLLGVGVLGPAREHTPRGAVAGRALERERPRARALRRAGRSRRGDALGRLRTPADRGRAWPWSASCTGARDPGSSAVVNANSPTRHAELG